MGIIFIKDEEVKPIGNELLEENLQLKHENQMLKLKLQQIQNTLNYD